MTCRHHTSTLFPYTTLFRSHHHKTDGSPYPVDECPLFRAFRKGEGCRIDTEVIWRRDGTPISVEYSSFPILEDGKIDRKSTRLNSSHTVISYAVFCLKKKKQ